MHETNYSWNLMASNLHLQANKQKNSHNTFNNVISYSKPTNYQTQLNNNDHILFWFIANLIVFTIVIISGLLYVNEIDFNHLTKKDYEILIFLIFLGVVNFIFFIISGYKLLVKDTSSLNKKSYNNYRIDNVRRNSTNTYIRLGNRLYVNGKLVV
jgi:uncharacterized membrane protein SpoIIM required for sporulation